ncbi:MarR family transcriptional regulator [Actinoplanes sp. URMC 104]|uniref:MarR family transcriptional regulator n=1 Tax=Actinoplanes sp. URMC 104 TaxID=3423409 RepID=UPI003F1BFDA2
MTFPRTPAAPAHSAFEVLAALADLGEATAATVAEYTQLGYSTVTPKLRAWEASGHAERFRNDTSQTLWRLTANGRAATETPSEHAATVTPPSSPRIDDHVVSTPAEDGAAASAVSKVAACPAVPDSTTLPDTGEPTDATENCHNDQDPAEPQPNSAPASADTAESESAAATGTIDDIGEQPELAGIAATFPSTGGQIATEPAPPDTAASLANPAAEDADSHRPGTAPCGHLTDAATTSPSHRRPSGSLRGAILDILEANPDTSYKISQLCILIDRANEGASARKASAGAVANAAHKLAESGRAVLLVEKPATFRLSVTDA